MISGSALNGWGASVLTAAVLGAGLWWYSEQLETAEAETAVWKSAAERNASALAELQKNRERLSSALDVREKELAELRSRHESVCGQLKEITAHDKEARIWSNTPVPDAVLGILRPSDHSIGNSDDISASARTSARPD